MAESDWLYEGNDGSTTTVEDDAPPLRAQPSSGERSELAVPPEDNASRRRWGRDLLAIAGILLWALAMWWLFAYVPFDGITHPDAMDYAQIGRNLWRSGWQWGVTTSEVTPLALSVSARMPFLNLLRAPLWPAALAAGFGLFGVSDWTVGLVNAFFYFAALPLLYLLGRRLFARRVGIAAAAVYAASPWILTFSVNGMSESLFVFLWLATLYLVVLACEPKRGLGWPLVAGLAAGLAYLTRYNALLLSPLIALYLFWVPRSHTPAWRPRLARALLFGAAFVLATSPWWVRNLVFVGDPLFTLQRWFVAMDTPTYPRFSLFKTISPPSLWGYLEQHGAEYLAKVKRLFVTFYQDLPTDLSFNGGSPYVPLVFFAGLFYPLQGQAARLRWLVGGSWLITLLGSILLTPIPRLLFPFYSLLLLFALGFVDQLVVDWRNRSFEKQFIAFAQHSRPTWLQRASIWLVRPGLVLIVVSLFFLVPTLNDARGVLERGFQPLHPVSLNRRLYGAEIDYIRAHTSPDDVLLTDYMDVMGWNVDRQAIWLPVDPAMAADIEALVPITGVVLSHRMLEYPEDAAWYEFYHNRPETILEGRYRLEHTFTTGTLFYRRVEP